MQYRLRTLFIVVAVLSVPMAYVGSQAKIVRERTAAQDQIRRSHGWLAFTYEDSLEGLVSCKPPARKLSWLRRSLGDEEMTDIFVAPPLTAAEVERLRDLFPEAEITVQPQP
jgi:hypothetical protein